MNDANYSIDKNAMAIQTIAMASSFYSVLFFLTYLLTSPTTITVTGITSTNTANHTKIVCSALGRVKYVDGISTSETPSTGSMDSKPVR